MKIHIVRKGDTLWEIAQQYGVDFEELKESNPQLSSPDMIMPGMKIKIPTGKKSVKKETVSVKETKVPVAKETPKQSPVIKEDDHEKPKEVKIEMPKKYAPELSPQPLAPKKEVVVKKEAVQTPVKEVPHIKEVPKQPVKPMKEMIKMPVMQEELHVKLPQTSQPKKHKEEKVVHQAPVAPIYHHYYYHCCPPPYHPCFPVMGEMTEGFMPHHMQTHPMPFQQQMMPHHDCGCHGGVPQMQQFQPREQIPAPFPGANFDPFGFQSFITEPQNQPVSREFAPYQPKFSNEFNHSIEKPFPMPPTYPPTEFNIQDNKQEQRASADETTDE